MKLNDKQVVLFTCCGKKWTEDGKAAVFDMDRGCFRSLCPKCGAKVFSDHIAIKKPSSSI